MLNINCITVGGNPINGHPGVSNTEILTKIDAKYLYYAKILPVWTIKIHTLTTKIQLG